MTHIVYLAGGINGLSDSDCKDWREEAKRALAYIGAGHLDPMRRDYRGIEDNSVADIVRGDLMDIDESHFVIAMCPRPSWGTAMEIHYCWTKSKPVFAVVPDGAVSPWLRYHATICKSLDEAIAQVAELTRPFA